ADLAKHLDERASLNAPPDLPKHFVDMFNAGVPLVWPTIRCRTDHEFKDNPLLDQIGKPRTGIPPLVKASVDIKPDLVGVTALGKYRENDFHFAEAGPRAKIMRFHPRVGILVSGGIAPGINAVIDGIVRRHEAYDPAGTIWGYRNGLYGLSQYA